MNLRNFVQVVVIGLIWSWVADKEDKNEYVNQNLYEVHRQLLQRGVQMTKRPLSEGFCCWGLQNLLYIFTT